MYTTYSNNVITLNIKQNRHAFVKFDLKTFTSIKPSLLLNMHNITNTKNSAHLWAMAYQCTPYDI